MPNWRETELKLGLPGEDAWRWVGEQIAPRRSVRQRNIFFDTRDRALRRERIGVRLRNEDGRVRLTVKGPEENDLESALSQRIELEADLEPHLLDAAERNGLDLSPWLDTWEAATTSDAEEQPDLEAFLANLRRIASAPLFSFGEFLNLRQTGRFRRPTDAGALDLEIELDRTHYPGNRTDYEIEVEFTGGIETQERGESFSRIHRALVQWCEQEGGFTPFPVSSKLARFEALLEAERR